MKRSLFRIVCLLLCATLSLAALSCRRGRTPEDTTNRETFAEAPDTEEGGGTVQPPPPPSSVRGAHVDGLILNREALFEGGIAEGLAAADYTLRTPEGTENYALELRGWIGFDRPVDAFGYCLDGGETVYGLFATYTENNVKLVGGEHALRYVITVPLFDLKAGAHTVSFLARLTDGSVEFILPDLTLVYEGVAVDASIPYHASVTRLEDRIYENRGGSTAGGMDILDATLDGVQLGQDCCLALEGWLALSGGVERYVWSADGVTWYPARTGGITGEPSAGHFAALGFENAAGNALFPELILDLTPCAGKNTAVTVGGVPQNAPDSVVPFLTVTGINVPERLGDLDYTYLTRADYNKEGTDLASSDLRHLFEVSYGAGDTRHVNGHNGALCYCYEGIHSFQTVADGCFALTAEVNAMTGCSFLFVRGTKQVRSVDEVPIPLHAFYETDGTGLCGGAGIYAKLSGGVLTLVVKALDPSAPYRIQNHIFEFPAKGNRLTLADDGSTVYVRVDGREITRVAIDGYAEYPEHFQNVSPYVRFAAAATVTLPDGRTEVIHDTLVAATARSHFGVAVRGGGIHFSELSVVPFSEVGISTD